MKNYKKWECNKCHASWANSKYCRETRDALKVEPFKEPLEALFTISKLKVCPRRAALKKGQRLVDFSCWTCDQFRRDGRTCRDEVLGHSVGLTYEEICEGCHCHSRRMRKNLNEHTIEFLSKRLLKVTDQSKYSDIQLLYKAVRELYNQLESSKE